MVIDEFDQDFVRTDRLRVRQRDCSRAERFAGPLTFSGRIRISGRYANAIGLGVIGPTRRR
jgi:hypothetical protein